MSIETYLDLAARIRTLPARAGGTRVIAVDGPAGAGKTAFAARLAAALGAPTVHLDDICPGWSGLRDAAPRLVEWVLAPLVAGAGGRYHKYDWDRDRYAEWHEVPAAPILIVEGVTSGSKAITPYLTFLIWVSAPAAVRIARGIERDGGYRSRWEAWSREEEKVFAADETRERADLCIDGAPALPHDPGREFVVIR
jgi:uridine kinase